MYGFAQTLKELLPLTYVRILFPLNILRISGQIVRTRQNFAYFYIAFTDIDKIRLGLFQYESNCVKVIVLDSIQYFFSA